MDLRMKRDRLEAILRKVCQVTPGYSIKKVGHNTYALVEGISWLGKGYEPTRIVGLYRVKRVGKDVLYQKKINKRWYMVDPYTI